MRPYVDLRAREEWDVRGSGPASGSDRSRFDGSARICTKRGG